MISMAKGNRFDSIQDVYNKALLEKYALIHYLYALDKYLRQQKTTIMFKT